METQRDSRSLARKLAYAGLATAGALILFAGIAFYKVNSDSKRNLYVERDVNGDKRLDLVLRRPSKTQEGKILIQRADGNYDVCTMRVESGIGFFPTLDNSGYYDGHGSFFSNNPSARPSQISPSLSP